jgi:hypothetical protein
VIQNEPIFNKEDRYFLGRTERIQRTLQVSRRYVELMYEKDWDEEEKVIGYLSREGV